jgi:hypothetical protein
MKRIIAALAAAAAIGGCVAIERYESRVTPEFHAQLVELKRSIKVEQDEQARRLIRLNREQKLENDRRAVENARLYVQIAQVEGRSTTQPNAKLRAAEAALSTSELASEMDGDQLSDAAGAARRSSSLIYAELPTHAHTYRDRLVLKRFNEMKLLSSEVTSCDREKPEPECEQKFKRLQEDQSYIDSVTSSAENYH